MLSVPGSLTQSDQNVTDSPPDNLSDNETSAGQKTKRRHGRRNRERHRLNKKTSRTGTVGIELYIQCYVVSYFLF